MLSSWELDEDGRIDNIVEQKSSNNFVGYFISTVSYIVSGSTMDIPPNW